MSRKKVLKCILVFWVILGCMIAAWQPNYSFMLSCEDKDTSVKSYYDSLNEVKLDSEHCSSYITIEQGEKTRVKVVVDSIKNFNTIRLDFNMLEELAIYDFLYEASPLWSVRLEPAEIKELFAMWVGMQEPQIEGDVLTILDCESEAYIYAENILMSDLGTKSLNVNYFIRLGMNLVCCVMLYLIYYIMKKNAVETKSTIFVRIKNLVVVVICSICLAVFMDRVLLILAYKFAQRADLNKLIEYFKPALEVSISRIYFWFIFTFIGFSVKMMGVKKATHYRYPLAGLLLVMLVIGQFTGSSIGAFDEMLFNNTSNHDGTVILGDAQWIRADEWAIEKPYYFAQVAPGVDAPYYNDSIMINGADMTVMAFAPVKDIMIIAKPSLWGFLFLPVAYAFSFYWNLRIILLVLGAFELGRVLIGKDKIAWFAAFSLLFAPPIQWLLSQWLVDIIISGMFAVVSWNYILKNDSVIKQLFGAIMLAFWGNMYIYVMYPAAQIPYGYLFLAIIIYETWKNWDKKPFALRKWGYYTLSIVIIAVFAIHFLHMSGEAVSVMSNTVYPGQNRVWGTFEWDYELLVFMNLFTGIYKDSVYLNNCEIAQFLYFFPFLMIGMFCIWQKRKSDSRLFGACVLFLFTCVLWIFTKLPEKTIFTEILLLGTSYPRRLYYAVGFGFFWVLWMLLGYISDEKRAFLSERALKKMVALIVYVTTVLALCSNTTKMYFGTGSSIGGTIIVVLCCIGFGYMGWLLLGGKSHRFMYLYLAISVASTIFVNPVSSGMDAVYEKQSLEEVREIRAKDPNGRWMISGSAPIGNLVSIQGAKRCSGYYYYPDVDMMQIIDPEGQYEDLWNSFSALDMRITTGENEVVVPEALPAITAYIDLETAQKLNIHYIFSIVDVPQQYVETGVLQPIYSDEIDNISIYRINYS